MTIGDVAVTWVVICGGLLVAIVLMALCRAAYALFAEALDAAATHIR